MARGNTARVGEWLKNSGLGPHAMPWETVAGFPYKVYNKGPFAEPPVVDSSWGTTPTQLKVGNEQLGKLLSDGPNVDNLMPNKMFLRIHGDEAAKTAFENASRALNNLKDPSGDIDIKSDRSQPDNKDFMANFEKLPDDLKSLFLAPRSYAPFLFRGQRLKDRTNAPSGGYIFEFTSRHSTADSYPAADESLPKEVRGAPRETITVSDLKSFGGIIDLNRFMAYAASYAAKKHSMGDGEEGRDGLRARLNYPDEQGYLVYGIHFKGDKSQQV